MTPKKRATGRTSKKSARQSAAATNDLRTRLEVIARDLLWTWTPSAQALFAQIDPLQWEATKQSPLGVLGRVNPERFAALEADRGYLARVKAVEAERAAYYRAKTWHAREAKGARRRMQVAYLCSEYAVHESLQQYSGGLGVLAGDHLKSASDLGVPLVAVGLLYQHGYYIQEFDAKGATRVLYPRYEFGGLPIEDTGVDIAVPIGRRKVNVRVWKQQVGRVPIYLLDADRQGNRPEDRQLTEGLYKGEPDLRLRQQVLLGVGGILALEAVGESPTVFHLNEGHAAFASLERMRTAMQGGESFERALEQVKRSTVFTTHTPVPAGHDRYDPKDVWEYLRPTAAPLGLDAQSLADMGRVEPGDRSEQLCMTVLALRTAAHVNGVSALHGRVSREMWARVYPQATSVEEVPIGHITNGVHTRTWLSPAAGDVYERWLKPDWNAAGPDDDPWARAADIPDEELWALRRRLRSELVQFVRTRLRRQAMGRGADAVEAAIASEAFDRDVLTIGFARRFATYKRAPLIFRDPERLAAILDHAKRPVQLVFAGKAHPRDKAGQAYAQTIHEFTRDARFVGRVALIEEYDMQVGRALTSGCDVWLNNPIRPHEASGTSGMKPPLHGGINLSILDGWWPESYDGTNGWAIGDGKERDDQEAQDAADAEDLYRLLEKQVAPEFYRRDKDGLPRAWIARARASLTKVPRQFSTHRMVADYVRQAYWPAAGG
ncbi:alpha-glucan family phosphorylase [Engelhardtia mirabilis]|uniref:Carbohydrate phosphorylase n=1 Tax=Engelhardtia mirabilis TaxID=2528011 RepID=A0A518BLM5_9BACT|nr:Carbohydrate phosphorylase [Planctomycetes bacterium Pla133]QDV02204.1 Carbohydrate phosphorylase [Planctomycetes bacterium Pla86]